MMTRSRLANTRRKMKGAILIALIIGGATVGYLWYGATQRRYSRELGDVDYIASALMEYARDNYGRLPEGWDDLVQSGNAERVKSSETSLMIYRDSAVGTRRGVLIENVRKYRVAFRTGPEAIERMVDPDGVYGHDGKLLSLIAPGAETVVGEDVYRRFSFIIASTMKRAANDGPATGPIPATP